MCERRSGLHIEPEHFLTAKSLYTYTMSEAGFVKSATLQYLDRVTWAPIGMGNGGHLPTPG